MKTIIKKTCSKCHEEKLHSEFYKHEATKDGLRSDCRTCKNKKNQDWRDRNPIRYNKMIKDHYLRNKKKVSKRIRQYIKDNPKENKAREAVAYALKMGRLVKEPCSVCGCEKVDGHHESYLKKDWLKVIWLCRKHHRKLHLELRKEVL